MTGPSIIDALAMWSEWHADVPPSGSTGCYAVDMQIADAFRMMIYLGDHTQRLRWIEREASDPNDQRVGEPYRAAIIAWWLAIYDDRKNRRMAA